MPPFYGWYGLHQPGEALEYTEQAVLERQPVFCVTIAPSGWGPPRPKPTTPRIVPHTQRTNRFPIEELYMTLTATGAGEAEADEPGRADRGKREAGSVERQLSAQRATPLDRALRHDRLVVVGLPGAGKTTFLRRITYSLYY